MRAVIKNYYISDEEDLSSYKTNEPAVFGFILNLAIGSTDSEGEDYFELLVASPAYIAHRYIGRQPSFLRHIMLLADYNVPVAVAHVSKYLSSLEETTWQNLALKINRIARWEYEDYRS